MGNPSTQKNKVVLAFPFTPALFLHAFRASRLVLIISDAPRYPVTQYLNGAVSLPGNLLCPTTTRLPFLRFGFTTRRTKSHQPLFILVDTGRGI
jgi:hypothetical protein